MKNQTKKELPKFILEKEGNYWQIWNTVLHEVVQTFETKQAGELWLKDFSLKF